MAIRKSRNVMYERQLLLKAEIDELKSKPCADCHRCFHPAAMDFDHVRGKKFKIVAVLVQLGNRQDVIDEIAKCDLVCANCHRLRTWTRKINKA